MANFWPVDDQSNPRSEKEEEEEMRVKIDMGRLGVEGKRCERERRRRRMRRSDGLTAYDSLDGRRVGF